MCARSWATSTRPTSASPTPTSTWSSTADGPWSSPPTSAAPGRNVAKLAELSRRTGVHVIAATGLHHDRYYGPAHWSARLTEVELADLFTADVVEGIDAHDYPGPLVRRTAHRP